MVGVPGVSAVLVDRHHADLFYGLQRLLEDRLDLTVYTPIGQEWWDAGVWQFGIGYGDDRLARQFLAIDARHREIEPGIFLTFDPCHPERPILGITLEAAGRMRWKAVVATVQDNQAGFWSFARAVGAEYVYQVGNTRQEVDWGLDPVVLNATKDVPILGRGVRIGQEIDLDMTFRFREPPADRRSVGSFVNMLNLIPEAWEGFAGLQARLEGWRFRSFGHHCPDGVLQPVAHIAEQMARTGWAYHDKVTGDGFGHVLHNWGAVGRPLIGHGRYYRGQRGEALWRDLETCIDLDRHSLDEVAEILEGIGEEEYGAMCHAIRRAVVESCDWEADAEAVRSVLL